MEEDYNLDEEMKSAPMELHQLLEEKTSKKVKKGFTLNGQYFNTSIEYSPLYKDFAGEFQVEVIRVLQESHANFQNKLTAVSLAQRYAALHQKSIKEGMKLRDKSLKWWKVLRDIPGVAMFAPKDKNPDDAGYPNYVKFYLKESSPPDSKTIDNRILAILKEFTTSFHGIDAGTIINKYTKRYGSLVSIDLAAHTSMKFTKYVGHLPGVLKSFEGSKPIFSLFDGDLSADGNDGNNGAEIDDLILSQSMQLITDDGQAQLSELYFEEPQFSPPSSPIAPSSSSKIREFDESNGNKLDIKFPFDNIMEADVESMVRPTAVQLDKKVFKQTFNGLMDQLRTNKGDISLRNEIKILANNHMNEMDDHLILSLIGCVDVPDDSSKNGESGVYIDDLVDLELLSNRMQTIEDMFSNEIAMEYFVNLKKFRQEQYVILNGLSGRLKYSLKPRILDLPALNSVVSVPQNIKPRDMTEQWLGTSTLTEAFNRIRAFPLNSHLIDIMGTLSKKISETLHIFPKPILKQENPLASSPKMNTYIYKLNDISYFTLPQYSRIVHSFRSYDNYCDEIAQVLNCINEKTNLLKCMVKSDRIIPSLGDLKMITKGIIKLMQDAVRLHSRPGREFISANSEDFCESTKMHHKKIDPLYNICQFVACKIYELSKTSGVDEDLVVNVLQSIKGHSIEDKRVQQLMRAISIYSESITLSDLKDERIVETLLQFISLTVGKYNHNIPEVDDVLMLLGRLLMLSYEKFVKSKFVSPGTEHPDPNKLDQLSQNILQRSKRYGFEASELRYALRNLSSSSKAARYFFFTIRPWLNFVFRGYEFDHRNIIKNALSLDQVTKSYLGLSKFKEDIFFSNMRSFFQMDHQSHRSLSKAEVEEIWFNFSYVVGRMIMIPFAQYFDDELISNYSSDFIDHTTIVDEYVVVLGKLLNPRVKYSFLKMIGKCCTHWSEEDVMYEFVVDQLKTCLELEIIVDLGAVKSARDSRKRKRDTVDDEESNGLNNFPFFVVWGLYCELIYNLGKGKTWRSKKSRELLTIIISKLKMLLPYIQDDLFTTMFADPPIEKRCCMFLKHLSMLTLGLECIGVIDFCALEIFHFLKKIFASLFYDVVSSITKDSAMHAIHCNNNIIRGLSRITSLRGGDDTAAITVVIHKQLGLFCLLQQDSDKLADTEDTTKNNTLILNGIVLNMTKCFQLDGFMRIIMGSKIYYHLESHQLFGFYMKNFEENFDKAILDLAKSKHSFLYFHGISELFRSFSAFYNFINFRDDEYIEDYSHAQHNANTNSNDILMKKRNPFDITAITSIIRLFCEKLYLAVESFSSCGHIARSVLGLLSSPCIRSVAEFNRMKFSLLSLKIAVRSDHVDDEIDGHNKKLHAADTTFYGDHAVSVLYNIRYFLHFLSQVHQSSISFSIIENCVDYVNFISDLNQMIAIQVFLVLVDFDELSSNSLLKLFRFGMSFLEYCSSMEGLPSADAMKFPRMDIFPYLFDNILRRSVRFLEVIYMGYKQGNQLISSSVGKTAKDVSIGTLFLKETTELFQECCYFLQFYYAIFPYSTPFSMEIQPDHLIPNTAIKEFFKIEIESLKMILDNVYDGVFLLPTSDIQFFSNEPGTIGDNPLQKFRTDDINIRSQGIYAILEKECIDITKKLLWESNQPAWNSFMSNAIVSSFNCLGRLEYSPSTIVSLANMYSHAPAYYRVENGTNCVTIYHHQYGRIMIFSSELQLVPPDTKRYQSEKAVLSTEDFHHHFLFDVTLESDFSAEGTFNLICNSAKMAKAFNVIYSLIIVNVDDVTSVGDSINMDIYRKALEKLLLLLLQYIGLLS